MAPSREKKRSAHAVRVAEVRGAVGALPKSFWSANGTDSVSSTGNSKKAEQKRKRRVRSGRVTVLTLGVPRAWVGVAIASVAGQGAALTLCAASVIFAASVMGARCLEVLALNRWSDERDRTSSWSSAHKRLAF